MSGGIIYTCATCGCRLNIVAGYAVCPRCTLDLTDEDAERNERDSARVEGTEA